MQAIVDLAYRNGRYAEALNYAEPPPDPLPPLEEAAWADAFLRAAGRRG